MSNHSVRIGQTGPNVLSLEVRIVGENRFVCFALSQQAQDQLHRDSHTSDDRLPAKDFLIGGDSLEKVLFVHHKDKIA